MYKMRESHNHQWKPYDMPVWVDHAFRVVDLVNAEELQDQREREMAKMQRVNNGR